MIRNEWSGVTSVHFQTRFHLREDQMQNVALLVCVKGDILIQAHCFKGIHEDHGISITESLFEYMRALASQELNPMIIPPDILKNILHRIETDIKSHA